MIVSAVGLLGVAGQRGYRDWSRYEATSNRCQLSLPELIQRYDEHRLCSVLQFKGRDVDWVIDNVVVVGTGQFYIGTADNWQVSIHLADRSCDCVPDLKMFQHYRVKARISEITPGQIMLTDATLTETNESMNAKTSD